MMAGKRIDARAHHGPEEDRAQKPQGNRGTKKLKMRAEDPDTSGLSAKDAARLKRFKQ